MHLRDVADRTNVTVQVIGFEYGLHSAAGNNLILLEMGDGLPDVFYSEGLRGEFATSDPEPVARNRRVWDELRTKALDEFGSVERIDRYLR